MNRVVLLMVTCVLGAVAVSAQESADAITVSPLFEELKCNRCHAMERFEIEATTSSEKMLGPDLSDVGTKRDPEWLTGYLKREVEVDGSKHKSPWKGDDKQLADLTEWLAKLGD